MDINVRIGTNAIITTVVPGSITVQFPVSTPGVGVPAGGDSGDVLTKLSATDYATYWAPPGQAGLSHIAVAGQNLSAGKVVVIDGGEAFYFQPSDPTHAGRSLGITASSATTGNNVSVVFAGKVTDAGFAGLGDSTLWVGANGAIQTTIPATGTIQKAGVGIGSNTILIDFSTQITRN